MREYGIKTDQMLKDLGLKSTPQRRAIWEFLQKNGTHPSAELIYQDILKEYPTTSFATVYNTLTKLTDEGLLRALHIDPKKKRYDIDTSSHAHLFCSQCENVFDVSDPLNLSRHFEQLKKRDLNGHQIAAIQIYSTGICRYCVSDTASHGF